MEIIYQWGPIILLFVVPRGTMDQTQSFLWTR